MRHAAMVVAIAVTIGSGIASAQSDWPHVRGPAYDGLSAETGLVNSWPAGGPPVLWTRDLSQGYSGFVVAGGRLFTQYQTKIGQFILALDPDSGAELWRQRVGLPWQPAGAYPGPYATPTWHDDRLYYTTPMGEAGCLAAKDGHELWSVDLRKRFNPRGVDFGYAATPLVENGRVILPVGGEGASLVALNVADGSTVWAVGNDPASYCPAYPITLGGRRLLVAFLQNSLALHDAATGERVWRQKLSSSYDEHSAWPLYSEPHLMVAAPFRSGAQLFKFESVDGAVAAKTIWAGKSLSNDVCSSILVGGHVYGFDLQQLQTSPHRGSRGAFKCLDFLTGTTKWETEDIGQATVLFADGKLILLNDTGTLILARANPSAYEELARAKVLDGGLCWSPPALRRGKLFVRNQSKMVCLFLGPESSLDPNRPVVRSAVNEDRFDWSRLLGRDPEFPHDEPAQADVARWFWWCAGGVFAPAALLALLLTWIAPSRWARYAFPATAFGLGLVGTTIFGHWADVFVLTWPASLYVAFRLLLLVCIWAGLKPWSLRRRLVSGLAILSFIALCYGYYRLCVATGYVMGWSYLAGFLPAMPLTVLAAKTQRPWLRWVADAAGFAVYFWCSGLLPGWKSALEE